MNPDIPTTNYTGALIFWAYIAAALYFTATVLRTINSAGAFKSHNGKPRAPLLLIILAISSFSTLSYHMLNVLITSYKQWATHHSIPLPNGISGPGSYFGPDRTSLHLWNWSITSTLFQDFGEAIVASESRFFLSSTGLSSTMAVASFMGVEGRISKMPNLWAFLALLEILPTSFSQTLFYIMLSVYPRPARRDQQLLSSWFLWFLVPVAYGTCLELAPSSHGMSLIYVILVARLILVLPFLLPLSSQVPKEGTRAYKYTSALYIVNMLLPLGSLIRCIQNINWEEGVSAILLEAMETHPAVKTLGWDLLHSAVAFLYWTWTSKQKLAVAAISKKPQDKTM